MNLTKEQIKTCVTVILKDILNRLGQWWPWAVLVAQSCPTLCDPMDCSPQGSSVHGILQARILERGAISGGPKSSSRLL